MKLRVRRHEVVQPQDQSIKLIPLTQGLNATVDVADYESLCQWNWWAVLNIYTNSYYAFRWKDGRPFQMQQQIMGIGKLWDHRDRNTLNNRRSNLRECTVSQNGANRGKQKTNTSGYKGVFRNTVGYTWMARIHVRGKYFYLGCFSDKESAARAYDAAAIEHFGEFAHLNFPAPNC